MNDSENVSLPTKERKKRPNLMPRVMMHQGNNSAVVSAVCIDQNSRDLFEKEGGGDCQYVRDTREISILHLIDYLCRLSTQPIEKVFAKNTD